MKPELSYSAEHDQMVWTIKCVREGCPGVQTRLLGTGQYGPCSACGATR